MGVDLASLKQRTDLISLASQHTRLRRESRSEYSGPCPKCGGRDRFHVHQDGWFFCRQCHERRGDVIEFVQWLEGCDFREAVQRLSGAVPPARHTPPPPAEPPAKPYPDQDWQARAWKVVDECQRLLWSDEGLRARDYLARRGLNEATILAFQIGFTPGGTLYGFHLERSIVLPWWGRDAIWKINQRRPAGSPKYRAVRGSVEGGLFGAYYLGRSEVLVITEGEMDAMLVWQEAGDQLDVTTVGGATVQIRPEWVIALKPYQRILLLLDNDPAGQGATQRWQSLLGRRAVQVHLPDGHRDVTDAYLAGWDIRAALLDGTLVLKPGRC